MKARAEIAITYPDAPLAATVARAVEPENAGFVTMRVDDSTIHAEAEAASAPALLHTLDDFLACVGVAEKATRAGLAQP